MKLLTGLNVDISAEYEMVGRGPALYTVFVEYEKDGCSVTERFTIDPRKHDNLRQLFDIVNARVDDLEADAKFGETLRLS